jgi:hypothetical protein
MKCVSARRKSLSSSDIHNHVLFGIYQLLHDSMCWSKNIGIIGKYISLQFAEVCKGGYKLNMWAYYWHVWAFPVMGGLCILTHIRVLGHLEILSKKIMEPWIK